MALSNLRNEPRREVIEQVAGIAAFALYLALVCGIVWWMGPTKTSDWVFGIFLVAVALPFTGFALFALAFLVHSLGEAVCGALAQIGIDPRPTRRYRR